MSSIEGLSTAWRAGVKVPLACGPPVVQASPIWCSSPTTGTPRCCQCTCRSASVADACACMSSRVAVGFRSRACCDNQEHTIIVSCEPRVSAIQQGCRVRQLAGGSSSPGLWPGTVACWAQPATLAWCPVHSSQAHYRDWGRMQFARSVLVLHNMVRRWQLSATSCCPLTKFQLTSLRGP